MKHDIAYAIAGLVLAAIIGYILVRRSSVRSGRARDLAPGALPPGWQFYSNPTTLEEPGTVFRIDPNSRRYVVGVVSIPARSGVEAAGKVEESLDANVGIVAHFLGLRDVGGSMAANKTERFVYEITDPVREVLADVDVDKALPGFMDTLDYHKGHRYFIIRESRKASSIRYRLTRNQVESLGGEVTIGKQLSAQGKVFSATSSAGYILEQDFKTPMRVMFLPEEIKPVTAGLAAEKPRLGLVAVTEPLRWEDPPQTNGS